MIACLHSINMMRLHPQFYPNHFIWLMYFRLAILIYSVTFDLTVQFSKILIHTEWLYEIKSLRKLRAKFDKWFSLLFELPPHSNKRNRESESKIRIHSNSKSYTVFGTKWEVRTILVFKMIIFGRVSYTDANRRLEH